jgi:hypothetical protein
MKTVREVKYRPYNNYGISDLPETPHGYRPHRPLLKMVGASQVWNNADTSSPPSHQYPYKPSNDSQGNDVYQRANSQLAYNTDFYSPDTMPPTPFQFGNSYTNTASTNTHPANDPTSNALGNAAGTTIASSSNTTANSSSSNTTTNISSRLTLRNSPQETWTGFIEEELGEDSDDDVDAWVTEEAREEMEDWLNNV